MAYCGIVFLPRPCWRPIQRCGSVIRCLCCSFLYSRQRLALQVQTKFRLVWCLLFGHFYRLGRTLSVWWLLLLAMIHYLVWLLSDLTSGSAIVSLWADPFLWPSPAITSGLAVALSFCCDVSCLAVSFQLPPLARQPLPLCLRLTVWCCRSSYCLFSCLDGNGMISGALQLGYFLPVLLLASWLWCRLWTCGIRISVSWVVGQLSRNVAVAVTLSSPLLQTQPSAPHSIGTAIDLKT